MQEQNKEKVDLPIPPHFDPAQAGTIWRVPYQDRAVEAEKWAREHDVLPAATDARRVCLLIIDLQVTFCIPGGELFVGGRSGLAAVEDNVRLCRFIYRNLHRITEIVATLDTHAVYQIFHPAFLVDENGAHPKAVTPLAAEDIAAGRWRIDPDVASVVGLEAQDARDRHLLDYSRQLQSGGKYSLMVWPYHALLGGIGHALAPVVEEAMFFHTVARKCRNRFEIKGEHPLTEHYSVLGPEVKILSDGRRIGWKNTELVERLLGFDVVLVAGQAKSHCVSWTVQDLLEEIASRDRSQAGKIHLLEDCTSPVVVPGAVDFTESADAAFRSFQALGARVIRAEDPLGALSSGA